MTAPVRDLYVTPDLVERFAAYYQQNAAWGVLHVSFDDGNFDCTIEPLLESPSRFRESYTQEERELARLHDLLSPSQRRKLAAKAESFDTARRTREGTF